MRKDIKNLSTGSIHSFGEGFEKPIFEDKKIVSEDIFSFVKKPKKEK